jgi:hypothetical protein
MYFDRLDICEAYYLFAMHYNTGGDTSDGIFARLHRMRFNPSPFIGCSDRDRCGLTRNGWDIYQSLVENHRDAR